MMQEGGAMMIKLEGGEGQIEIVEHLARHDIPVCAHLGLKPQSVHKIGGFRVQGREAEKATEMVDAARSVSRTPVPTSCCSNACPMNWAGQCATRSRFLLSASVRGLRCRRADPRALRHSRHHAGTDSAFRQKLPARATHHRSPLLKHSSVPSRTSLIRPPNTASPEYRT